MFSQWEENVDAVNGTRGTVNGVRVGEFIMFKITFFFFQDNIFLLFGDESVYKGAIADKS